MHLGADKKYTFRVAINGKTGESAAINQLGMEAVADMLVTAQRNKKLPAKKAKNMVGKIKRGSDGIVQTHKMNLQRRDDLANAEGEKIKQRDDRIKFLQKLLEGFNTFKTKRESEGADYWNPTMQWNKPNLQTLVKVMIHKSGVVSKGKDKIIESLTPLNLTKTAVDAKVENLTCELATLKQAKIQDESMQGESKQHGASESTECKLNQQGASESTEREPKQQGANESPTEGTLQQRMNEMPELTDESMRDSKEAPDFSFPPETLPRTVTLDEDEEAADDPMFFSPPKATRPQEAPLSSSSRHSDRDLSMLMSPNTLNLSMTDTTMVDTSMRTCTPAKSGRRAISFDEMASPVAATSTSTTAEGAGQSTGLGTAQVNTVSLLGGQNDTAAATTRGAVASGQPEGRGTEVSSLSVPTPPLSTFSLSEEERTCVQRVLAYG